MENGRWYMQAWPREEPWALLLLDKQIVCVAMGLSSFQTRVNEFSVGDSTSVFTSTKFALWLV
jgi:hypothetical protein